MQPLGRILIDNNQVFLFYFSFSYLYLLVQPNSSSMRMSWLYLAIRSVRESEPVLICPLLVATAMSAIVVSSVSPER